ncbi:MAG: hypothetical protein QOE65_2444 [Solirubrobacteraceae bacterium]|nr:hypothetical protein [Solirubrobacteraceae bacterium]
MHCHGTPSSRLDAEALARAAADGGVRLLSPDRPGTGGSAPRPAWSVAGWAAQAAALADALGIERFAVSGWSGGGPYALACAAVLPERVTRVTVVACPAPPHDTPPGGALRELNLADRALERLSIRAPLAARAIMAPGAAVARHWPALAAALFSSGLSASDRAALAASPLRDMRFVAEAFRQGTEGAVLDYRALGTPWGFDLADVAAPVTLWHGETDRVVPAAHTPRLAARLPHADPHVVPGAGHLVLASHAREIVDAA